MPSGAATRDPRRAAELLPAAPARPSSRAGSSPRRRRAPSTTTGATSTFVPSSHCWDSRCAPGASGAASQSGRVGGSAGAPAAPPEPADQRAGRGGGARRAPSSAPAPRARRPRASACRSSDELCTRKYGVSADHSDQRVNSSACRRPGEQVHVAADVGGVAEGAAHGAVEHVRARASAAPSPRSSPRSRRRGSCPSRRRRCPGRPL